MCDKFEKLGLKPFGAVPSQLQIDHLRNCPQKAFFHIGPNTFTGREWSDGTDPENVFNPTELDVRQWIRVAKDAGFTMGVLTTKHHDGFCLWPTKTTEHNISKSPYKNGKGDLVKEFTDACHEMGMMVGIYLSPWDNYADCWGTDAYSEYYNDQLTELMSNYGEINEIWWDGAGSKNTRYDWGLWANTIRTLQPKCAIYGTIGAYPYLDLRWVGNECGFAEEPHYSTIDNDSLEKEIVGDLCTGKFGGERYVTAEVDVSIRPGWFYHKDQDDEVKSPEKIAKIWFESVGRSCVLIMNLPPDQRGLVHETDSKNAIEAHGIIEKTFAVNLASGGKATASSQRADICDANMILDTDYNTFYTSKEGDLNPVIEIELPKEEEFDCLMIGEVVELGQRIKGYRVEAEVDGEWKELCDKKSIGFRNIQNFEAVTSKKVRITIYDSGAEPVIREFGLYKKPYDLFKKEREERKKLGASKNLAKGTSAQVKYEADGVTVDFGGIYPFNTITFNGNHIWDYEIFAFDGAKFYSIYKDSLPERHHVIHLDKTIESSYKLKLVTGRQGTEDLEIGIFEA